MKILMLIIHIRAKLYIQFKCKKQAPFVINLKYLATPLFLNLISVNPENVQTLSDFNVSNKHKF